jgi:sugar/nucleoside kinase (ribokinase family)
MAKRIDVLTFGDLCVDLILSDKDIAPEFGQKEKMIHDYSLQMGGSCSIFACQAAKLGLKTSIIGKVGTDAFGQLILNNLNDSGVCIEHIQKDPKIKTGITVILNAIDDRAMLTYNGTIDGVEPGDIPDELLKTVRHLHIGSYFLMKKLQPCYPELVKKLKKYGATISMDTNWDPEEKWNSGMWDILPYVDIFLPNENEAMAITGEATVEKAIDKLKEVVGIVVVKMGAKGAIAYKGGNIYRAETLEVEVVDSVGAGDSFDGGFVYGYLSGKSVEQSLRIGCICGSLNVTKAGGTKGQPGLEEINCYLGGI